jgi:hypothetical protein
MYVGIGWALGLLMAAGWGLARLHARSLLLTACLVVGLFGLSESARLKQTARQVVHAHVPQKSLRLFAGPEPPALRRYAQRHRVYHPAYPGLGADREEDFFQGSDNVEALLWSGLQPRHLVDALLRRRFDLVYLFENDGFRGDVDGYGQWEENYFWKLNEVIKAKYRPATGPRRALKWAGLVYVPVAPFYSPYVFERRPGPDPAPWMDRCFGPFDVGGATFRIAAGGGFWCRTRPGGSTLRLVATRAARSEIRDDGFRAARGSAVAVRLARPGRVRVSLGSWRVERARPVARATILVRLPAGAEGPLSIVASRGSGAEVALMRATARPGRRP